MKRLWLTIFAIVLAFTLAAPAQAEFQDMWAKVYKWTGEMNSDGSAKLTAVTTGITFQILAKDSNTQETLYVYGSNAYTSLTNPVSTANYASTSYCKGQVQFRVDPTDTTYDRYVDVIVTDTNGGFTKFVEDFDKYTHTIVIDERPNVLHHGLIPFRAIYSTETSTGVNFLAGTKIKSVQLEVVTGQSARGLSVGRGGANNHSFINRETLANTGYITTSFASTGTDLSDASSRDYPNGYTFTTDTAMYTLSSGATSTTPKGYIHYYFSYGRK